MNDSDKIIAGVILTVLGLTAVAIFGLQWSMQQNEKAILAYNQTVIEDFYDYLDDEGIEIISEEQYVVKTAQYGGALDDTVVIGDVYNADYHHRIELYDPLIDYSYYVEFSHAPKEELEPKMDISSEYREEAQAYYDNFKLIRKIINSHGGEAELISGYDPKFVRNYFLLIYLPDADAMIDANMDLYDHIYGGYVNEHVHNGIKVQIPRFIFCSNKNTYQYMASNIDAARQYIRGKNYICNNSVMTADDVNLERVCDIMLDQFRSDYNVTHVPGVNTLGSTVCKNYLQSCDPKDFIALHELELGIDYYLTVYEPK